MAKKSRKNNVARPHNCGTMTDAAFYQMIRSALRSKFRFWLPIKNCLDAAHRKYVGPVKQQKHEYQCNYCKGWFKHTEVQVDHIIECGSIKSLDDVKGFIERLTTEDPAGYQVLCSECHTTKTKKAKDEREQKHTDL